MPTEWTRGREAVAPGVVLLLFLPPKPCMMSPFGLLAVCCWECSKGLVSFPSRTTNYPHPRGIPRKHKPKPFLLGTKPSRHHGWHGLGRQTHAGRQPGTDSRPPRPLLSATPGLCQHGYPVCTEEQCIKAPTGGRASGRAARVQYRLPWGDIGEGDPQLASACMLR